MSQTTRTVKTVKVPSEAMQAYKDAMLEKMISDAAEKVKRSADTLWDWAKSHDITKNWTYMSNKDVYYIPDIAGIMPNWEKFEATFQNCNCAFGKPSMEKMKFGGFEGDFPTEKEAVIICRQATGFKRDDGKALIVKGVSHDGLTCRYKGSFACYNLYRRCQTVVYGRGTSEDYGWNIPIVRFHGEDSMGITLGQTLLYWLQYDLYPDGFKSDEGMAQAFQNVKECKDYIMLTADDKLALDEAKVEESIRSGKELSWMPKEAVEILPAKKVSGNQEVIKQFRNSLLCTDADAIALDPYDEKILSDPNRGHWDLWDMEGTEDGENLIELSDGFTARNPAMDVSDGIVAIDFGTKSTVVVCETDELQVRPLQVGSGTYSKGIQEKDYENPTILQFLDLDSFLTAYAKKSGRPATSWNDLTVSHNAFQNMKDASSDQYGNFFDGLKQWCGIRDQRLKLQDAKGKVWELPPFMELQEQDMDPLEIYAYYLGRYINHMLRGKIYLHYVMSFPVTYEHSIREHMGNSIRKGLKKSFPTALLANEEMMKKFCVREVASEPAAYAITALQEFHFEPEGDEKVYYAVFDFGGGTTDFDYGMFKESESDRYDYVLTHFGENGDRTLGGENLLRFLAYEVFRANKEYLLQPDGKEKADTAGSHIPFATAPDAKTFVGEESYLRNSREAQQNMRNLMEKLRPVWENPESDEAKKLMESGQIQLTLFRENGEKKTDANLKLKTGEDEDAVVVDLQGILRKRIEEGIDRFFISLAEAFDKNAGQDSRIAALSEVEEIYIFLAGNSSRSSLVTEIFQQKINEIEEKAGECCGIRKLLRFGENQAMPAFIVLPPLGTEKASQWIKEHWDGEDSREPMMRPTGKTGVAYGLLKCRDGGEIKVESITPDGERVSFQYYIGRRKKGKFRLVIDRSTKLGIWYKFIDAGGDFDILYTQYADAAKGDAPMTIAKQKHITIEKPDDTAFVYIRPVESKVIEYTIAHNENELETGGRDKSDPKRIELE